MSEEGHVVTAMPIGRLPFPSAVTVLPSAFIPTGPCRKGPTVTALLTVRECKNRTGSLLGSNTPFSLAADYTCRSLPHLGILRSWPRCSGWPADLHGQLRRIGLGYGTANLARLLGAHAPPNLSSPSRGMLDWIAHHDFHLKESWSRHFTFDFPDSRDDAMLFMFMNLWACVSSL